MIGISFNLSKYRLDLKLVKRRNLPVGQPLFPDLGQVLRSRNGSKVSRFFRLVFENKRIRKIFAINTFLVIMASSFIPPQDLVYANPLEISMENSQIIKLTTEKGVRFPVDEIRITQGYKLYHPAIDLDGVTGDPIYPIMAGAVEEVAYSRFGYGNIVIVNHGSNITSLYSHLSKMNVKVGDEVTNQTVIGLMGATGRAFGDHLHLEIRESGKAINPMTILPK